MCTIDLIIVAKNSRIRNQYYWSYFCIQTEVQALQNKPIHVQKEADREAQKLEQLQDMHDNLCNKHMEGLDSYRTFQSKIDKYNLDLNNLIRDEGKLSVQKKNCIRETERLMAQMEALLTREQIMLDRVTNILLFLL